MSDATDPDDEPMGLGALAGLGELGGLGGLLEQAQNFMAASAEAADKTVTGRAGGGAVQVVVNGRWEFQSVSIEPDAVDPSDLALLEDLVLAALRDAARRIDENQLELPGGLDIDSLGLGGLGDE